MLARRLPVASLLSHQWVRPRVARALFLAAAAFVLLSARPAQADEGWLAGAAKISITPTESVWLSGYAARKSPAEGTESELFAKALWLDDQLGHRTVLITLDLVGIHRATGVEIASRIMKRYELPRSAIAIASSHTHCGPVVGDNLISMYFLDEGSRAAVRRYHEQLLAAIDKVVEDARLAAEPCTLAYASGRCTFATNRRHNKPDEVAARRAAGTLVGPVDHDVPVLAVRRADTQALAAIVFGYACHATTLDSMKYCGDWPGYAQSDLEAQHPGAIALFATGCGADQNPLPRRSHDLAKQYGAELAAAVASELRGVMQPIPAGLTAAYREIDLAYDRLPTREELEQTTQNNNRYEARRATLLLEQLRRDGQLAATYPYPVQTWTLGPAGANSAAAGPAAQPAADAAPADPSIPHPEALVWTFLGGEVTVEYALAIKSRTPQVRHWVTAYANDVMAYIPSRHVLATGGYEGGGSMLYYGLPSPWKADVEARIWKEVERQHGGRMAAMPK